MAEPTTREPFAAWAKIEIMGHISHVGWVQEVAMFGATMVRVDTLDPYTGETGQSHYYGAASIYSLTPIPEEEIRRQIAVAREHAARRAHLMAPRRVVVEEEDSDPQMPPSAWLETAEFAHIEILDPDGWREDGAPAWTTPLTRDEFTQRLVRCTVGPRRREDQGEPDEGDEPDPRDLF